jgi:hypothetical protein
VTSLFSKIGEKADMDAAFQCNFSLKFSINEGSEVLPIGRAPGRQSEDVLW